MDVVLFVSRVLHLFEIRRYTLAYVGETNARNVWICWIVYANVVNTCEGMCFVRKISFSLLRHRRRWMKGKHVTRNIGASFPMAPDQAARYNHSEARHSKTSHLECLGVPQRKLRVIDRTFNVKVNAMAGENGASQIPKGKTWTTNALSFFQGMGSERSSQAEVWMGRCHISLCICCVSTEITN